MYIYLYIHLSMAGFWNGALLSTRITWNQKLFNLVSHLSYIIWLPQSISLQTVRRLKQELKIKHWLWLNTRSSSYECTYFSNTKYAIKTLWVSVLANQMISQARNYLILNFKSTFTNGEWTGVPVLVILLVALQDFIFFFKGNYSIDVSR